MYSARPKPEDTEEDLLKSQREFLAAETAGSAKVVRKPEQRDREKQTTARDVVDLEGGGLPPQLPSFETGPKPSKKTSRFKQRRKKNEKPAKQASLFAQQFSAVSPTLFGLPDQTQETEKMETDQGSTQAMVSGFGETSSILEGSGLTHGRTAVETEVQQIHQENVARLVAMTEEQIQQERDKLLQTLDPSLIQFLASKKKQPTAETQPTGDISPLTAAGGTADKASCPAAFGSAVTSLTEEDRLRSLVSEQDNSEDALLAEMDTGVPLQEQVPIQPSKDWLNMDVVEHEKLEWMKDLPAPKPGDNKGKVARFDLEGQLMSRDKDVPTHLGLHHHGDEPEVAGYTLEELFMLSRSRFPQQRTLALQVLARVVARARNGEFAVALSGPLLPMMLESGMVFVVRFSLDENTPSLVTTAVEALHSLLVLPGDELCADHVYSWYRGSELPALCPERDPEEEGEEGKGRDKTDQELAKEDIIKGLLRMTLLPRLRYILEVLRPDGPVVIHIVEILIRVARHSLQAAYQVLRCPHLMETVFTELLPLSWADKVSSADKSEAHGRPLPQAMKLMRVLCTAGRNITAILISKHSLMERIMRYTAEHPSDLQLDQLEAFSLAVESLRTWATCAVYGLGCEAFTELYPVVLQTLQRLFGTLSAVGSHADPQAFQAAALFRLIEGATHTAGVAAELAARLANVGEREGNHDNLPAPPINWSHVTGLLPAVQLCVKKWVTQAVSHTGQLQEVNSGLVASCLHYLASYLSKLVLQPSHDAVGTLQYLEELVTDVLLPLINSDYFITQLQKVRTFSPTCQQCVPAGPRQDSPALPDMGCRQAVSRQQPWLCVHEHSPYNMVTAVYRLAVQAISIHKGLANKLSSLVTQQHVVAFLSSWQSAPDSTSYWLRFEHHLLYHIIKLFTQMVPSVPSCHPHTVLYHRTALTLLRRLVPGDEHYIHDLMSTVIFQPHFFLESRLGDPEAADLSDMLQLSSDAVPTQISSAAQLSSHPSRGTLLQEAYSRLPGIRATYIQVLQGFKLDTDKSRNRALHRPHQIQSLLLPVCSAPLLPTDWVFLPLVQLHSLANSLESRGYPVESVPTDVVTTVTNSLRLILMLEMWRPDTLTSLTVAAKLTRLMCVFLTGSELFLDGSVHHLLSSLLRHYTQPGLLTTLDFNVPIPGITSFYDLYKGLLGQYEATSFGDSLFASFVLLPLQQKFGMGFKKLLLSEHDAVFRTFPLQFQELVVPVENYLEPQETDHELLQMYLGVLLTGTVRQQWAPIFYLIMVKHITGFIFASLSGQDTARRSLLRQVMSSRNETLKHHLLHYKKVNLEARPLGFDLHCQLPPDRLQLVQDIGDL
ncbi:PREDICTED: RNA polymerase II-associated protein 1-like [Branchiostoma belcheri]|uniref:RNA polymerase II-associated protein 1-like n=1 Tax=Branchiostoma belcheri TaxID=7741 RepID=A0A6P5AP50_BRABE|nr:PREDICTED: RNA polymerase II-associated protein 1-like [Branchiostoma belcheri]